MNYSFVEIYNLLVIKKFNDQIKNPPKRVLYFALCENQNEYEETLSPFDSCSAMEFLNGFCWCSRI